MMTQRRVAKRPAMATKVMNANNKARTFDQWAKPRINETWYKSAQQDSGSSEGRLTWVSQKKRRMPRRAF
eukprot:1714713-Lingulodinium_polyedra.AAC.1